MPTQGSMILEGLVLGREAHIKGAKNSRGARFFHSKRSYGCHIILLGERKEFISYINEDITRLVNCALRLCSLCC